MTKSKIKKFSLLDNAYNFILESMVYYRRAKRRSATWPFALLNLIQGIELLLKHVLRNEHSILIYENVDKPKNTVSMLQALDRLRSIAGFDIDEKEISLLLKASKYRNLIVHYEFKLLSDEFRNIFAQLFEFVHYFHHKHLNIELHHTLPKRLWEVEAELMLVFNRNFIVYNGREVLNTHPAVIMEFQHYDSVSSKGRIYKRIAYGSESINWSADIYSCHDCAVVKGQYHTDRCDVEECPICGVQLLGCGCDIQEFIDSCTS